MSTYSYVVVERLEKNVSDHCPQLLRFETTIARRGLFKFFNVLADHEEFEGLVRANWSHQLSTNKLRDVWLKCQKLKGPLKQLNTKWFVKTSERVDGLRTQLHSIQQLISQIDNNTELIQDEKRTLAELEKWSGIEEQIWRQKARIDWLKLGDSNTKFFHAYTKVRQNSNAIHRLVKSDGTVCLSQAMIKQEVKDFYNGLMGIAAEELSMVDKIIVGRGLKLTICFTYFQC